MKSFKNIGASAYRRITNEVIKYGEIFTCESEKEEAVIEAEGSIGIRLEEVGIPEQQQCGVCSGSGFDSGGVSCANGCMPATIEWTAKVSPEDYLKRFPRGPQALAAREFLRRKELSAVTTE